MIVTLTDLINLKFKMYYIIIKCLRNFRPKQKNRRQAMERWPMASIPILTASNAGSTSMWFNTKNIIFVNPTVIFFTEPRNKTAIPKIDFYHLRLLLRARCSQNVAACVEVWRRFLIVQLVEVELQKWEVTRNEFVIIAFSNPGNDLKRCYVNVGSSWIGKNKTKKANLILIEKRN